MDIHNTCLVVAVLSLSVSCVVIWLSLMTDNINNVSVRHERDINSILRDLHTSQKLILNTTDHKATLQFLSSHNLLQEVEHNLGNYFTGGYFIHRGKYHREYSHSPLTILPFFHDIHGEFERCLLRTALAHKHAVSPKMTYSNRLKWDASSEGVFKFKHKFKVHYGQASFGICSLKSSESDKSIKGSGSYSALKDRFGFKHNPYFSADNRMAASYTSRCGHAFIMQDPTSLAISDLGECILNPRSSQICQLIHQNATTVEEWIATRGSIVFRHILFTSDICLNKSRESNRQNEAFSEHNSSHTAHLSPKELCESNHAKFVDNLEPRVIEHLVSFITENIHKLFSVVGIFEDIRNSLTLLNHVFQFPLHKCEFLSKFSDTSLGRKSKFFQRVRRAPPTDSPISEINAGLFKSSNYRHMPSLPRLFIDSQNEADLLEAFTQIENNLVWDKEIRTTTTSVPSVSENYQTSDIMFDYDVVDSSSRETADQEFLNLTSGADSNGSISAYDSRLHPVNDSRINPELLEENSQHFQDLFSKDRSIQFDIDEEDDLEESDDSTEDVMSENMISSRSTKLKTDAVLTRLFNRFLNSHRIRQSLAPDLRIYEAVKKLYFAQKQLFFNSM